MEKQRNETKTKTKTKTNKKSIVQQSIATSSGCSIHTPGTSPAKTIKKKDRSSKIMTSSSSNQDSAPESTHLTSNKIIDPPISIPPITH